MVTATEPPNRSAANAGDANTHSMGAACIAMHAATRAEPLRSMVMAGRRLLRAVEYTAVSKRADPDATVRVRELKPQVLST